MVLLAFVVRFVNIASSTIMSAQGMMIAVIVVRLSSQDCHQA